MDFFLFWNSTLEEIRYGLCFDATGCICEIVVYEASFSLKERCYRVTKQDVYMMKYNVTIVNFFSFSS